MKTRELIAWLAAAYLLAMCAFISMAHPKDRSEGYATGYKDGYSKQAPVVARTCEEARTLVISRTCTRDDGEH